MTVRVKVQARDFIANCRKFLVAGVIKTFKIVSQSDMILNVILFHVQDCSHELLECPQAI